MHNVTQTHIQTDILTPWALVRAKNEYNLLHICGKQSIVAFEFLMPNPKNEGRQEDRGGWKDTQSKIIEICFTCMSERTLRATLSGWSLASLSSVARKFLHFILAVSGVICCPMPPAALAVSPVLLRKHNNHENRIENTDITWRPGRGWVWSRGRGSLC